MNTAAAQAVRAFGDHLRHWRQHRRMSQLDLAGEAGISTRHLSYVETGRSAPSREMVLRLAERLEVPLRERNAMLVAAGYAPMYRERPLDDPALAAAREAVQRILTGHEPYPALAVDRHWNLVSYNTLVPRLLAMADASLLQAPVNVLRLSLHPLGLAPHLANLTQWRTMHVSFEAADRLDPTHFGGRKHDPEFDFELVDRNGVLAPECAHRIPVVRVSQGD